MLKQFQRTIESFICAHCGTTVRGSGYTNHCPQCLWSRHVDINPGDRRATCGGMMEPIAITQKHGAYIITHQCRDCGHRHNNKTISEDNIDTIINITVKYA